MTGTAAEQDGDAIVMALLAELADAREGVGQSMPRLGKRLGLGASTLIRLLNALAATPVVAGEDAGWVTLLMDEQGRWTATLTPAGRAAWLAQSDANAQPAPASQQD